MLTEYSPRESISIHRRLSAPAVDPIELDIARQHLRQDSGADDIMIEVYLRAAVDSVERDTGRALISQRWEYTTNDFSLGSVWLPRAPVLSIESVKKGEPSDEEFSDFSGYVSYLPSGPNADAAQIRIDTPPSGLLRVTYVAGYGPSGRDVPAALNAAVLLALGSLYENREAEAEKSGSTARMLAENPAYERLIRPYRLIG